MMLRGGVLGPIVVISLQCVGASVGAEEARPSAAALVAPSGPPVPADAEKAAVAVDASQPGRHVEEMVVTGSRIRRRDLTTPAPVTVITKEEIAASGKASIGDLLQALPEQGDARNTAVNNGGDGSVRVNLRSLGASRTLVLINGRRMVPGGTGADSSVDLSSIPMGAIERIEVLKDGASAVYGSDAIGGVVNLITRKNWAGSEVNFYAGDSSRNDAGAYQIDASTGVANERGSMLFSVGYFDQQPAMAGDRTFSNYQYDYDATGQNNSAGIVGEYASGSMFTPNGSISASGSGNAAWQALTNGVDPQSYLIHDATMTPNSACVAAGGSSTDCQWRPMNTTSVAGRGGDLYNFAPSNYLMILSQRLSLWLSGDAKLGETARAYFEGMYVNRRSKQQLAPEVLYIGPGGITDQGGNYISISPYNLYNPFGATIYSATRRLDEFGYRIDKEDVDTFRLVTGIDGTLSNQFGLLQGWLWDLSGNYGRTKGTDIHSGSLQSSRVADALGPSMMINGKPACVRTPNDPTSVIAGCVPLDVFHGSGSITPDQVASLEYVGTATGSNEIAALQFNLGGELFKLASERAAALSVGYEYRYVAGDFTWDPLTAKSDSSNGGAVNTSGYYSVTEGYGELSLPIVSDVVGIENLEASIAGRVFDYSNFGSGGTYKFGVRYMPISDVTLRGTYSTGFRAPSIGDLYLGAFDNNPSAQDPCANPSDAKVIARCGAAAGNGDNSTQVHSKEGGNPNLKPETAKTFTVGVVLQPSFVRNLSVTVDYYDIRIEKAIGTVGVQTILDGCYTTGKQPDYCQYIQRDPVSHKISAVNNVSENVGKESVAGIDIGVHYTLPTIDYGRFGFNFDGTWLQRHDQVLADGTTVHGKDTFDLQTSTGAGGINPSFKFNAGIIWGLGGLGAGVSTKFISGFHECGNAYGDFSGSGLCYIDSTYKHNVDSYNTYDLFVSYGFVTDLGKTSMGAGVNNVFDTPPVKIYNGFASATDQYSYDQIGRYFYMRLAQSL